MLKNIGNINTSAGNVKPRTIKKYEVWFYAQKPFLVRLFTKCGLIKKTVEAGNAYKARRLIEREYKFLGFIKPNWISVQNVREISQ